MKTYDVPSRLTGEVYLAGYGRVAFEFDQGPFVPSDEKTASVLERLAAAGIVTEAEPKTASKKKAEPVAAEPGTKE